MDIGVYFFSTAYSIGIEELAVELEERGFESMLIPEHPHIPASRRTPWPGGGDLPKEYYHTYDPFVALSFAAAATKSLKIGTGICLLPQRDPIVTAKSVASLDELSGGRVIFGIGGGFGCICCGVVILIIGGIMAVTSGGNKPQTQIEITPSVEVDSKKEEEAEEYDKEEKKWYEDDSS